MGKIKIASIPEEVDAMLPKNRPDGSRIGVNYADAFGRQLNTTLPDGRAMSYKRRGLQITLNLGDQSGAALMDRIEGKEDPVTILNQTLAKIARELGYHFSYEDRTVYFEDAA